MRIRRTYGGKGIEMQAAAERINIWKSSVDKHKILWYKILVIDFCARPLWDFGSMIRQAASAALHTLLSLYADGIAIPICSFRLESLTH